MATATAEPDRHHAAQVALTVALAQSLRKLWPGVDVTRLKATLPGFYEAMVALVQHYSAASVSLAADEYLRARRAAGVGSPFRTPRVPVPSREQIMRDLVWATNGLWGKQSLTDPGVAQTALSKTEAATERLVLNASRDELIASSGQDREARGWAREARPDACWWCAMLATRGVVYDTAESAGRIKASDVVPDAKGFLNRFHTNCRCRVVPVFGQYEATAQAREWQQLWAESTKDADGMEAKQHAFQEAYEDRSIDRRGSRGQAPQQPGGFENLTRGQIELQIRILESLKDSDYKREQLARLRRRLAQL